MGAPCRTRLGWWWVVDGRAPWWCGRGRALPDAPRMVVVVVMPCAVVVWAWARPAGTRLGLVVVVVCRRRGGGVGRACRTRLGWWWWWMMPCAVVVWAWARPAGRASDGGGW
ncbi:hypothetical protein [Candidatus Amarobacter glycogenicus]|uniref:hypothetical protein n=1 Tax=Candidatus Amarobacter glycogenicus TaxID=3140699 RepID=UPI002A14F326|nr:hypothetical protein [Dehalococcoidia bacterium]